jgi:hypothetical protein
MFNWLRGKHEEIKAIGFEMQAEPEKYQEVIKALDNPEVQHAVITLTIYRDEKTTRKMLVKFIDKFYI